MKDRNRSVCFSVLFVLLSSTVTILYAHDKIIADGFDEKLEIFREDVKENKMNQKIANEKITSIQIQLSQIGNSLDMLNEKIP